tara:strand:- start:4702 stop:5235 length:534 start_codon:yes stop_codon:yes gene_type:complete
MIDTFDPKGVVAPRPQHSEGMTLASGITMTPIGAVISDDLTFEDFEEGLKNCQVMANASLWTLGDILLYAEAKWGEKYAQAIELTKKSYATLSQAVRVSKSYPQDERLVDLSWSHHREAASIKDKDQRRQLLEQAAREGWSRDTMREMATDESKPKEEKPEKKCPSCGYVLKRSDLI